MRISNVRSTANGKYKQSKDILLRILSEIYSITYNLRIIKVSIYIIIGADVFLLVKAFFKDSARLLAHFRVADPFTRGIFMIRLKI